MSLQPAPRDLASIALNLRTVSAASLVRVSRFATGEPYFGRTASNRFDDRSRRRIVKSLVDLIAELEQRQVHFKSLTDGIDTKTPAGRFFFHVTANLAQMERELIVERTRAGLAAARQLGRVGGRKRRMTESKIASARKLLQSGAAPSRRRARSWRFGSNALPMVAAASANIANGE